MAEQAVLTIVWPLLLGLFLSFVLEQFIKPRPLNPLKRPLKTFFLHMGVWLLLYSPFLVLFRRPWFASVIVLCLLVVVILVSNAKHHSLREPFIYHDFSYFRDAVRYPRLYLPFLGIWSGVAILVAVAMAGATGMFLERSQGVIIIGMSTVITVFVGSVMVVLCSRDNPTLQLDPCLDLARSGLFASLWQYRIATRQPWRGKGTSSFEGALNLPAVEFPNLVTIQSESFFDPRRWLKEISPELLQHFDRLKHTAIRHGQLAVPAWGANTVRTEFAFLSGIANEQLEIHRFKPYSHVARQGIPTIATFLKRLGYRTVCLHPYSAQFYDRDAVFPLLGFDEFIDISRFGTKDYAGQYVGDAAVAREICIELEHHDSSDKRPVFLFVITMENHGPLHLDKVSPEDRKHLHLNNLPQGCDELIAYLRHLEQADQMLGTVHEQLASMGRPGWLCLYGDHLPIMPEVYRRIGSPDGLVDYLIWSNQHQAETLSSLLSVEQLPVLLVQLMGVVQNQEGSLNSCAGAA
jgi:hypothetical protein